ncbi:hypothetical protein ERO13_D09G053014v2 [Gossypium hirsutum]|uniref:S-protein homolog n=4 Tax=Gossypium TaxID=3633 RepID=A0A0D2SSH3_GOSRA|nr:hypothetical protein ES319_D09G061300v1 [Gossypium barbadense]KAG4129024.1 hypothetical protein ERO13_D09G053014v2 [Gossypium hirsutum]KJB34245.1 hypothetical protein B456_006G055500 [Gossypium raimondii]TYG52977.1 hypothetical protein ES288_D09G071800v1 [Gossypium darwinii]TYI64136.1 hypothetical protein E1A91_D09G065400v1 [Gossypium mustelinum]
MFFSIKNLSLSLIFFMVLLTWSDCVYEERTVVIQISNNISQATDLMVHCKSKNDDLGAHVIPFSNTWQFHFRPNFWGTTLYFCKMVWEGETKWFDIFNAERDNPYCHLCKWSIVPTGPCRLDVDINKTVCFNWNT